MCDTLCQYTIFISDWVNRGTPITAAWYQAIFYLEDYPHDEDKIWQMANAKVEGTLPSKILEIKNNPPEPTDIVLVLNPDIFFDLENSPKEFHKHNQNLAPTREDDNEEKIMPECAHDTDVGFDLRYSEKNVIKLEPRLCTCIDLKIALEIPATTIVQLAFRSSLAKRGITIREGIINTGYVGNIMAMLQNDSEKTYIIEPNEKIVQAIFLPLVRIAQLVPMGNREELGITARGIQRFGSTDRIDIPVNMMEKVVIDKGEIISTCQSISILSYDQYMLYIKREVKNQAQLFEAETTICKLGEIGLTNLYISAKSPKNIKILIYNTTESIIEIPKETIIRYLTTEVEDQPPNHIPDFLQLCGYVDITSQTIYGCSKCYLL
ncbi:hypothetical protein G9A89_018740 [Geosiphon pyriformis]|nr:hypothetical protein G9A89_018740 [Geosiphon pyriformis]